MCMTSSFLFIPFFSFTCPGKRGGFRYPNCRYTRIHRQYIRINTPTLNRLDYAPFFPSEILVFTFWLKTFDNFKCERSCRYHQCRRWECAPYVAHNESKHPRSFASHPCSFSTHSVLHRIVYIINSSIIILVKCVPEPVCALCSVFVFRSMVLASPLRLRSHAFYKY